MRFLFNESIRKHINSQGTFGLPKELGGVGALKAWVCLAE